ncbi:hypothetical protein COL922a_012793 [Colletotrichum nupharicola]|nr:hypothetical protein COL922a_012793 [Colletotrichum nupharicola]
MFSKALFYTALGATLSFTGVQAQLGTTADVPLDIDGAFEGASVTGTAFNSGGSITCNGQTVTVPKNLQVTFPAAFIPFPKFVANAGSYKGYECSIVGNIVGGKTAVAAQVEISPFATTTSSGYITETKFNGDINVNVGGTSVTIRINDPNAVYSAGNAGLGIDPFFTADDVNPSVSSFSGFPMCVPRSASDPLCPMSNRPGLKQGSIPAADANVMAPLIAGDFITFSGYQTGGKIVVFELVAFNIQITTTGTPTYVRMEDANIGVWTADTVNQEIAQTKFVGYTSDSATTVNPIKIQAIDYDRCTGQPVYRDIATVSVPNTEPRNKFEYRTTAGQKVLYAREYYITTNNFNNQPTANGIPAGSYVTPVTEWIQPEDSTPGRTPTGHDFSSYGWMINGLGRDADGNLWGPLDPFPQSGVTVFDNSQCPPASAAPATPATTPAATPSSTSSAAAAATSKPPVDTVTIATSSNWASSGGGTLTVQCISSNTNDNLVSMKISYTNKDGTSILSMTAAGTGKGVWNFSGNKIKQPTKVTCTSNLGGSASRTNW